MDMIYLIPEPGRKLALVLCLLSICVLAAPGALAQAEVAAESSAAISSPDGTITLTLTTDKDRLHYKVNYKNTPVVEPSGLGLVIDGITYGEKAAIGKTETYSANTKFPMRGVHSVAVNKYKGGLVTINSVQAAFVLDVRVFDDGVAFRYLVNTKGKTVVEKDLTAFVLPEGSTIWSQPNIKNYEGRYTRKKAEEFKAEETIGPPATILLPGNTAYAAITEAGLVDFAGMSLVATGNSGFSANLAGAVSKTGRIETPWRVLMIGKDLNTLVNNDIVANVSPAPDKKLFPRGYDTGWVKPGRSVWSWLAGRGPVTLENMKNFTDMAAALGFEYNLVDEGWGHWKEEGKDHWDLLKELVDYSKEKGVKIWVWKAYPDRRGIAGIKDAAKRKEFFRKCRETGVAGVKVDFFDAETQDVIQFYQAALRDAAENQLMLNFHGANKPTGESRTWPNEMTREAVKGLESRPPWAPMNVTLPFTRYLAGPADFTPIHFGDRLGEVTWAHHIAGMAIFTSPFLCVGADPQSIIDHPARRMIQRIPTTWDETVVLPASKIGELAVFARRKGDTWFLAAMNGENEAKTVKVNLAFLKRGNFLLHAVKDEENIQAGAALENDTKVSPAAAVTLALNPNGGYIARIEKVKTRPWSRPAPVAEPLPSTSSPKPAVPPSLPPGPKKSTDNK